MKIYLATDHAGFEIKEDLRLFLKTFEYEVEDFGAYEYDGNDDYPDLISKAVRQLVNDIEQKKDSRVVVLGGSGQGEAMCANRFHGVRSAVYYGGTMDIIRLSREHNDANVLSLGARFLSLEEAREAVRLWLETEFSGETRHQRRIEKLD